MMVYDWIIYAVLSIMLVYTIYRFLSIFFESGCGKNKRFQKIFYIVYVIIIMTLFMNNNMKYNDIHINVLVLTTLIFSYKGSVKKKLIVLSLIYSVAALTQTSMVIFLEWTGIEFLSKSIEVLVIQVPNLCIQYAFIARFKQIQNLKKEFQMTYLQWMCLVIFPIGSMILSQIGRRSSVEIDFIMGLLLMIIFNTIIIYFHNQTYRQSLKETEHVLVRQQNKYYEKQIQILKKEHEEIRIIKHDYKNHNIVISQYLKKGDIKAALLYTEQLLGKKVIAGTYSDSGNMVIDSIINYKLNEAEKEYIQSQAYIVVPKEMNIIPQDLTIILGNLLDNAIEGAVRVREDKEISVQVVYDKGLLLIAIENTFDGIVPLNIGQLVTRKKDIKNHGLGLRSIQQIVDKYKGETHIVHRENKFYVSVLLYDYIEG